MEWQSTWALCLGGKKVGEIFEALKSEKSSRYGRKMNGSAMAMVFNCFGHNGSFLPSTSYLHSI